MEGGHRDGGEVGVKDGGHSALERWMETVEGGGFSSGWRDGGCDGNEERENLYFIHCFLIKTCVSF